MLIVKVLRYRADNPISVPNLQVTPGWFQENHFPMSPFLHSQSWGDFLLLLCSHGLSKAGFIGLSHHYFVSRARFAFTDTLSTTHTLELLQLPGSKSTTYSVKQSANLVSMETKLNQLPQQQKYLLLYQTQGDDFCWK